MAERKAAEEKGGRQREAEGTCKMSAGISPAGLGAGAVMVTTGCRAVPTAGVPVQLKQPDSAGPQLVPASREGRWIWNPSFEGLDPGSLHTASSLHPSSKPDPDGALNSPPLEPGQGGGKVGVRGLSIVLESA